MAMVKGLERGGGKKVGISEENEKASRNGAEFRQVSPEKISNHTGVQ